MQAAMASLAQTIPCNAPSKLVATPHISLHPPARINCTLLGHLRTSRRLTCKLSDVTSCTALATGRRDRVRSTSRANEVPPGELMTEDENAEKDSDTCEVVQGSDITLGEGQGTVQAYLIQAVKNNTGAGVLFLTDILGFSNGDTRDFAYRLACFGYNVLVPDLFRGIPWSKDRPKDQYESWRGLHSPDKVAADINLATEYLVEHFGASGKLGVIGFCFGGGRLIEILARDSSKVFVTGAFVYGTRFDISLASQIRVPLLLIAGDSDDLCTTGVVRELEQTVQGSKAKIYPGVGHAFAHHPSSPEEDEAAEDVFTEIRNWFHDCLQDDPIGPMV